MKPSDPPVQRDLFSSVPAPPALASLQQQHDELVELLSQLLWNVARSATGTTETEEADHDQDRC